MRPVCMALALLALVVPTAQATEAGQVKYRLDAKSYFDQYSNESAWIKAHIARVLGYTTFAYKYVADAPTLCYHDAYTTWGRMGLNPQHRAEYAARAKQDAQHGCGHFADDIEFVSGQHQAGSPEEVAKLVEATRAAIGSQTLEINTQQSDLYGRMKEGNPIVARMLAVVNQVDREFGVTQITTAKGYAELFAYADALHAKGIHLDLVSSEPGDEYSLASYLLLTDGGDFIGAKVTPPTWWAPFGDNLGEAKGTRSRSSSGLWSRHFTHGSAYAVEPGGKAQSVAGHTLKERQGLVILE